jgi:hypothetical protein
MEAPLIADAQIEAAERRVIDAAYDWVVIEERKCASAEAAFEDAVADLARLRRERRQPGGPPPEELASTADMRASLDRAYAIASPTGAANHLAAWANNHGNALLDLVDAQAAQIAELTAECERHASDNLNVVLGWRMMLAQAEGDLAEARADLSAARERERATREAMTEVVRLRLATDEGTLAKRADRMWQIATDMLAALEAKEPSHDR